MKQLKCEMCESTELLKKDGLFICQSCGTKYTVEEAKKMMVEVVGAVTVQNAAQLDNLLNLARNSFDSKNFAQAEEFCNQVLAMDDKNYDAWKLKGEAINYQITSKNQRILEVYNCIMTSYRVLNSEQQKEKRDDILSSLVKCLESEVSFWLKQFEVGRPTDSSLTRVKNAYTDSYNKISTAFDELGLGDSKKEYLTNFDNIFIYNVVTTCNKTWKSTVGYNYYRDDFSTLGRNWGQGSLLNTLVTTNTDSYRPMKSQAMTFIEEGDNLISLLKFAEEQFNKNTDVDAKIKVYDNIIYYHERISNVVYYKIGSSGNLVGWCVDGSLTEDAKKSRKKVIDSYNSKKTKLIKNIENQKKTEAIADNKGKNINELIALAFNHLRNQEPTAAEARFDAIIEQLSDERIGYLGKAIAIRECFEKEELNLEKECNPNELSAQISNTDKLIDTFLNLILTAKEKTVSSEYESDTNKLLNYPCSANYGTTPLMYACDIMNLNIVKALLEMGADIHKRSTKNATALFHICFKALPVDKASAGREIAKILLDMGASVYITNEGGVALYNPTTDSEIARMIQKKYPQAKKGKPASSGGCYVATAVYGSYDCPQVWTLRRYRDYTLAKTWYGRAFIRTYYATSPTLVKWFGSTEWFKKIWQNKLDHMVAKLQANGIESTPYKDRNW